MGTRFEALDEGDLLVPLDPRYTQVGLNLSSVQVCVFRSVPVISVFVIDSDKKNRVNVFDIEGKDPVPGG